MSDAGDGTSNSVIRLQSSSEISMEPVVHDNQGTSDSGICEEDVSNDALCVLFGYQQCAAEAVRYLVEEENLSADDALVMGLVQHLWHRERSLVDVQERWFSELSTDVDELLRGNNKEECDRRKNGGMSLGHNSCHLVPPPSPCAVLLVDGKDDALPSHSRDIRIVAHTRKRHPVVDGDHLKTSLGDRHVQISNCIQSSETFDHISEPLLHSSLSPSF